MRELLVATTNPGKFSEIMEVVEDLPFRFVFLANLLMERPDLAAEFEGFLEDGETFCENAYKKAAFFAEKTGMTTLAEDSGIIVSALEGELGVKTRRWGAGEDALDDEWIDFFMRRMSEEQDRRAKFVCCACVVENFDDGDVSAKYFEGETSGLITDRLMAPIIPGLPLSSCFLPDGFESVYAALSKTEKNLISHRGKAIHGVRKFLEKCYHSYGHPPRRGDTGHGGDVF